MNCPNCKLYNPRDARYCAHCSTPLTAVEEHPHDDREQRQGFFQPESPYVPGKPSSGGGPSGGLSPRNLGDLLTATFAVYRENFGVLIRIALVAQIPLFISDLLLVLNATMAAAIGLVGLLTGLLANAAVTYFVAQRHLGRLATSTGSYVVALNFGLPLLANGIVLVVVMVMVMAMLLIVNNIVVFLIGVPLLIFIAVAWFFYVQAVMVEAKGPGSALIRSWELVRRSWWRVFGIGIVFAVLAIIAGFVVSIPGLIVGFASAPLGNLLETAGRALTLPIVYIGAMLVYLDLRVRKEGYTLDMLASEMG